MGTNPSPDPKINMWNLIAFYLRFLRTQKGLSGEDLGRIMRCGKASVSRIENGVSRLDGTQAALADKGMNTGGILGLMVWYASIGHDPQWFAQYMDLEARAYLIKIFEAQTIPGLLQTEDYARALLMAGMVHSPEGFLQERMERQAILGRDAPPRLTVLLSQNALEWPVGSPEIMRAQLGSLLEASELRNVCIRVVPRNWETGAYIGLGGSFSLMMGDGYGEVAYTESPGGGRLVSSPADVREYEIRFDLVSAKALPEGPSRDFIRAVMEGIE
ncbi:helix-turn-helix transcriptional regulator [Spirillospora sp. NPDC127200]